MNKTVRFNLCASFIVGTLVTVALIFSMSGCQGRTLSRLTGKSLKLTLPDDFSRPISFAAGRDGEKDLFYESKSGEFRVKTYSDTGLLESGIVFKVSDD